MKSCEAPAVTLRQASFTVCLKRATRLDEVSSVLWKINRPAVLQLACQRLEELGTVTAWLRAAVVRYVPRDSLAAANLARKRRACVRRVDKHQQQAGQCTLFSYNKWPKGKTDPRHTTHSITRFSPSAHFCILAWSFYLPAQFLIEGSNRFGISISQTSTLLQAIVHLRRQNVRY